MTTVSWIRSGSGDWSVPGYWSGDALPGAGDDVLIEGSLNVTHGIGVDTIRSLSTFTAGFLLTGGPLTIRSFASFNGSFRQSAGTLTLGGSGGSADGVFTQLGGSLVLRSGYLTLAGAGNIAGSISGAGELDIGNNTTVLSTGASVSTARLGVDGGTLKLTSNQSYANSFNLSFGNLALNNKTFTLSGNATFGGGTITGPGTVTVTGAAVLDGVSTSGAATITLSGTSEILGITLDGSSVLAIKGIAEDSGGITLGAGAGSTAKLNVLAGGTLRLDGGVEILGNGGGPSMTIAGTLLRTGESGLAEINSKTVNNGLVESQNGDLQFLGPVSGSGTFKIDAGALLGFENTVAAGSTVSFTGTSGLLRLGTDAATNFAASIANFHGGDEVQLSNFNPDSAHITGFSGGVLSVTDGTQTANLAFSGAGLTAASFYVDYAQVGTGIYHS